jgi:uncharacterized membrane protein YoaT (DUF817 family)
MAGHFPHSPVRFLAGFGGFLRNDDERSATRSQRLFPVWPAMVGARGISVDRLFVAVARLERRIASYARFRGGLTAGFYEFVRFGLKQAWACLFGGIMLALLVASHLFYPADAVVARYDALTVAALLVQLIFIVQRLETREEVAVIFIFHLIGTVMEIFKTSVGSWVYPEPSLLRIAGVPLFTGFMYAAVGSYIARVWRLFDFRFTGHPPLAATAVLALAIYVNFFTHHYTTDIRLGLFVFAALLFGPCWVHFRVWRVHRRMPLLLGLTLVALFIWFAENLGTFARAWVYPSQAHGWSLVSVNKLGSWFLLMLISYVLVSAVQRFAEARRLQTARRV